MDGVFPFVKLYFNTTGLFLARGWVLWFVRNHSKRLFGFASWVGVFALLSFMSYQAGASPAPNSLAKATAKAKVVLIAPTVAPPAPPIAHLADATASATLSLPAVQGFSWARQSGNGYAYGNCTYYVANRRSIPNNWGNANSWLYRARMAGFATGSLPRIGAIAWTGAGFYGHVALVEAVSGSQIEISEMNYAAWNRVDTRWAPITSFLYIY